MAETEYYSANKRKASPEVTEDAIGKRMRLEDGDAATLPTNGTRAEAEDILDERAPVRNERYGSHSEGSPTRTRRADPEPESRRSPEARRPSAAAGPPARRNVSMEEKKRGQRLFGGLVSTLSRTTSSTQQQRRLDIERRQQEKAQQRRAEDEKRRAEKLERLKRVRQIEQVKLDERAMNTRHSTMLSKAHSLHTESEPRLYYLPWELTKEQEDIISDQVHAAQEAVDRERRDFKTRREQRLRALGVTPPPRSPSPPPRQPRHQPELEANLEPKDGPRPEEATVGEPKPPPQDTNPGAMASTPPKARDSHHDKDHDEHGDEMMQDKEDIVIY
ncbi:pinin/SDK/memA/ protein conserved region-domain-containing protein [Chaetomium fimeti]|uniref:Pinin/SDK/memA/ protein conserved region-domain-containing protein n=1 Tax=Chaetomium fimeti TaxID=1854472 RepID=A0AAE0HG57_9PEZI|nr:pinin/SDK/memA/ protein conserved region-domain-containing protein [Chaetomium fimeti]